MQHELYSWELIYNDMVQLDGLTPRGRFMDQTLKEWIGGLDRDERRQFTEALYSILSATDVTSVSEITTGNILQGLKNIDDATRDLIDKSVGTLLKAAKNNLDTLLR